MEMHDGPDELEQAPTLRGIQGHTPFVVPEGFFDTFPHLVQQRAVTPKARTFTTWKWLLRPTIAVAGVALIAFMLWQMQVKVQPDDHNAALAQDWSAEDLVRAGVDLRSVQTLIGPEEGVLDPIVLPKDDHAIFAYLEQEELPLDLLTEGL